MEHDAVSTSDDRQPYHRVNGKTLTQMEWREQLKDATELFDAFKRQAYKDKEI
jgi:signal-transduction protein with cAMP-binding, CBS, and nucleotidyltransferase domain